MTITIITLKKSILTIHLQTHNDYLFFSDLFESDKKGDILTIQKASTDFKHRLKIFDKIGEANKRWFAIKAFFEEIPENSKFLIVPGKIDDTIILHSLKQEVVKLNEIPHTVPEFNDTIKEIESLYYTQDFCGNTKQRQYIGEANKNYRICRFCGQRIPEISFKNTSHAISESLGNKSLISREECDYCNEKFSKTIEPDIANMLSCFFTIYSIQGKKGIRKTIGENFKLSSDKSTAYNNNNAIIIQLKQEFVPNPKESAHYQLFLDTSPLKYTPQNVYKCLCKYVISVIDNQFLPNFQKTINWINSTTKYCRLPWIAIGNSFTKSDTPKLFISIRKGNNYNYPYCIAIFTIATVGFAFIVPFSSKDKYHFTTSKKYEIFRYMIQSWYKGFEWHFHKLSSSRKINTPINFTLNIPQECELGRDFFCRE